MPFRNPAINTAPDSASPIPSQPNSGGRDCAWAESGQTTAPPLSSAMNSRRFISDPDPDEFNPNVGNFHRPVQQSDVRSGQNGSSPAHARCPFGPQDQTSAAGLAMSAKCHQQTFVDPLDLSLLCPRSPTFRAFAVDVS